MAEVEISIDAREVPEVDPADLPSAKKRKLENGEDEVTEGDAAPEDTEMAGAEAEATGENGGEAAEADAAGTEANGDTPAAEGDAAATEENGAGDEKPAEEEEEQEESDDELPEIDESAAKSLIKGLSKDDLVDFAQKMAAEHLDSELLKDIQTKAARDPKKCRLFIKSLPFDMDAKALKKEFKKYGVVQECTVAKDRATNRSRGFGFVTYTKVKYADKAIAADIEVSGRKLIVQVAKEREPRSYGDRGSQSYGGGGSSGGGYRSYGGGGGGYNRGGSGYGGGYQGYGGYSQGGYSQGYGGGYGGYNQGYGGGYSQGYSGYNRGY